MSPRSQTYEYLHGLETQETHADYVLKIANARELISNLPSPQNVKRNLDLVPDIQIDFLLSTTKKLPKHIVEKIQKSENQNGFRNDTLLGLCSSGRGMPVEIFLHDHFMMAHDPSGELFEEVAWHETVHGIEGIKPGNSEGYIRHDPWSYRLQQAMLDIDEKNAHTPDLPDSSEAREYINYLRSGTSLQENVSEIFARVAVVFMYEVKETGRALTSTKDFLDLLPEHKKRKEQTRKDSNISDFLCAWGTFSEESQQLFNVEFHNLIRRAATLYGCDLSPIG